MVRVARIERKTEYFPIVGGDIKATNDDQGIIEGYLNYIGNIDYGDDRTMKGAFRNTIRDSFARKSQQGLDYLWPYLWNHDYNQLPPGGIFDADETSKGLYTKTQFNLDIQLGRELYSSFKVGTMKKQSMGYKAIQVEYVKDEKLGRTIRNLLEVAVMEGSAVVFPMNDLAQVDTIKNQSRRTFYMTGKQKQGTPALTKDYAADYQETIQQDWVSDLWNLWYPLRNAFIAAMQTGDTPVEDARVAIGQFTEAALAYMERGVELDMMEYLQPDDDAVNPVYGYMTADDNPMTKKLSADSHAKLMKSVDGIAGHVKEMKSELSRQRANALQGYQVYSSSEDDPPQQKQENTPEEPDDEATRANKMREALYDLSAKLQFQNAARGI